MNRWEKAANWLGRAEDRTPLDKTLIKVATILITSSFVIAALSTVSEFVFYRLSTTGEILSFRLLKVGRLPARPRVAVKPLQPTTHPLRLLPESVADFTTIVRQEAPGERYAAEAIYSPESADISPAAPLNTYVKITYNASEQDAIRKIKRALKDRYSRDSTTTTVDGRQAYSGYEQNYASYYLAWAWKNYSIEIDTGYTQNIPAQRGTLLPDLSLRVAKPLMDILKRSGI